MLTTSEAHWGSAAVRLSVAERQSSSAHIFGASADCPTAALSTTVPAYCVCIEERFIIIGYQELTTDHSECEAVGVGDVDNIGGTLGQCCCETECS